MRLLRPAVLALSFLVLASAPAQAQTEADKATARQLAEEGVRLKQDRKFAEALDKLERAQQIYDAPTHLLLIAQCQVALGKLVVGAETYRTLIRRKLEAGAPRAFRDAQTRAAEELRDVEARIPAIRIELSPEGLEEFAVKIDGADVPPAVVGVNRLLDPGHHVIEVSAPGYEPAKVQVQVAERQQLPVKVVLEKVGAKVAPVPPPPTKGDVTYTPEDKAQPAPRRRKKKSSGGLEFVGSLHLQGTFIGGDFGTMRFDDTTDVKGGTAKGNYGESGGGVELQGGLRFANHFAGVLLLGADGFGKVAPDSYDTDLAALYPGAERFEVTESSGPYFGAGFQWYSCRDCMAMFAEASVMVRALTQQVQFAPSAGSSTACTLEVGRSAPMARLLAGLEFPVTDTFRMMPFASASAGGVGTMTVTPSGDGTGCPAATKKESSNAVESGGVFAFGIGVSGSLVFGLNK